MRATATREIILAIVLCGLWPGAACAVAAEPAGDEPTAVGAQQVRLSIQKGQDPGGTPSSAWLQAVSAFNDPRALASLADQVSPFNAVQLDWFRLIAARLLYWEKTTPVLRQPFGDTVAPAEVTILVGNIGGNDAFVAADTVIAFDLRRLAEVYGDATEAENSDRIDRFFAHEYTHLLHRAWRRARGIELASGLERALWACLSEGLGNYRSLSPRWVQDDGTLSAHAEDVLARLAPIFVERLAALATADEQQAEELMRGLSMGPFEQKWGALPVALWLVAEVSENEDALALWVERGHWGVLDLARKHLPDDLEAALPEQGVPH